MSPDEMYQASLASLAGNAAGPGGTDPDGDGPLVQAFKRKMANTGSGANMGGNPVQSMTSNLRTRGSGTSPMAQHVSQAADQWRNWVPDLNGPGQGGFADQQPAAGTTAKAPATPTQQFPMQSAPAPAIQQAAPRGSVAGYQAAQQQDPNALLASGHESYVDQNAAQAAYNTEVAKYANLAPEDRPTIDPTLYRAKKASAGGATGSRYQADTSSPLGQFIDSYKGKLDDDDLYRMQLMSNMGIKPQELASHAQTLMGSAEKGQQQAQENNLKGQEAWDKNVAAVKQHEDENTAEDMGGGKTAPKGPSFDEWFNKEHPKPGENDFDDKGNKLQQPRMTQADVANYKNFTGKFKGNGTLPPLTAAEGAAAAPAPTVFQKAAQAQAPAGGWTHSATGNKYTEGQLLKSPSTGKKFRIVQGQPVEVQ